MKKFLALAMLTSLILIACNKATAPTTPAAQAPVSTVAEPAKSTPGVIVDEVIANPPKGCPAQTTVIAASKEVGTVKFMNKNSWYIEGNKNSPGFATLHFVNFDGFDPENQWGHTNKGKDVSVNISLNTKDKSPIKQGIWGEASNENNKVSEISITTETMGRNVTSRKSKIEFTYVGTDYVCGNIDAADKSTGSVNGEFIAKYAKQK